MFVRKYSTYFMCNKANFEVTDTCMVFSLHIFSLSFVCSIIRNDIYGDLKILLLHEENSQSLVKVDFDSFQGILYINVVVTC